MKTYSVTYDQTKYKNPKFKNHKVLLEAENLEEAKDLYKKHYKGNPFYFKFEEVDLPEDLFESYEYLPNDVKQLIQDMESEFTIEDPYQVCKKYQGYFVSFGYNFEWGLDGEPYNLHLIEPNFKTQYKNLLDEGVAYFHLEDNYAGFERLMIEIGCDLYMTSETGTDIKFYNQVVYDGKHKRPDSERPLSAYDF